MKLYLYSKRLSFQVQFRDREFDTNSFVLWSYLFRWKDKEKGLRITFGRDQWNFQQFKLQVERRRKMRCRPGDAKYYGWGGWYIQSPLRRTGRW